VPWHGQSTFGPTRKFETREKKLAIDNRTFSTVSLCADGQPLTTIVCMCKWIAALKRTLVIDRNWPGPGTPDFPVTDRLRCAADRQTEKLIFVAG